MSKKVEKILVLAENFEQKAAESLVTEAKKKDSKKNSKKDSKKDSKKSDPKSKSKDSKKSVKKSFLNTYEGLISKFGQAKGTRQVLQNGTWVTGNDDTEISDGDRIREWDGTRWKEYSYRAADDAFVDWSNSNQLGPTPPQGGGGGRGGGGSGGAAQNPNYGNQFEQGLIKKLQGFLNKSKFNVGIEDGKLGPQTALGLKRWQKSVGLPETGQLDRATFEKLAPSIPEFKTMLDNEPGKTVKAPVSSERASALIDQAYEAIEKLLPAYQSGQMMQNKAAWLAYLTPFYQSIGPLYQQINGLVNSPQIDPEQKKEFQALLPKLNQSAIALGQYYQILTGQQPGQQPQGQPPAQQPPAAR